VNFHDVFFCSQQSLQRFYAAVEKRALDPSAAIPELDPTIAKYVSFSFFFSSLIRSKHASVLSLRLVNPDPTLMKRADPAWEKFKAAFPLVKQAEQKKREKRHWRDYFENQVELSEGTTSIE
jgi:hypothetical protein